MPLKLAVVPGEAEVDAKKQKVQLSMLFKWYESDFGGKSGVLKFLERHTKGQSQKALQELQQRSTADVHFCYNDYDWSMNSI